MTFPTIVGGAVCWCGPFEVDADGSPHAYHPDGSPPGLDYLTNAKGPGGWVGVVCNAAGVPVIQQNDDPAPGFLVSSTSLIDSSCGATNPRRYVDSEAVPYVSVAHDLTTARGVRMGDLAWVTYKNMEWGAVVADIGPRYRYGEGSIALANRLSIPASPKNGGVDDGVTWIVFPGSAMSPAWPRTNDEVLAAAQKAFATWGGEDRMRSLWT